MVFRWDYKTSELGFYWCNLSTALLDFLAWLGENQKVNEISFRSHKNFDTLSLCQQAGRQILKRFLRS